MSNLTTSSLLSRITREKCFSKLKELPSLNLSEKTPPKTAAVLIPICVVNGAVSLLYTLRSTNLKNYSGQVSFPGGKTDDGENAVETALRETEEELGIPRSQVDVWGEAPQAYGRNNEIVITPVIGFINNFKLEDLIPSTSEVEKVFSVSVVELCDQNSHAHTDFLNMQIPVYLVQNQVIWGITAMMTHLFLSCWLSESMYVVAFERKKIDSNSLIVSKI